MSKQILVRGVDDHTHKLARVAALEAGLTLNDWVIEAIRIRLEELKEAIRK